MSDFNLKGLDLDTEGIVFISPTCNTCRNLIEDGLDRKCTAFPDGIPLPIWQGENDHTSPYPGDHGIHYDFISLEELDPDFELTDYDLD